MVDLVGYRRYGHSEVDDPTVTQPLLYKKIKALPPLWQSYAQSIGAVAAAQEKAEARKRELAEAQSQAAQLTRSPVLRELPGYWSRYKGGFFEPSLEVATGVAVDEVARLSDAVTRVPANFHVHPKVEKLLDERYGKSS